MSMNCTACGSHMDYPTHNFLCEACNEMADKRPEVVTSGGPNHFRAEFITKDSGQRQDFATGARRDIQTGKPRFDLIPVIALKRVAELYARGAEKYGEHNWQKDMPISRMYASLYRHLMAWAAGDREEDHLAAIVFNANSIMYYETQIDLGNLPEELRDM